jgi:hypothetical protein
MALEEKVLLLSPDIAMASAEVIGQAGETTGMEAANILVDQPKTRWRDTTITGLRYIDIDLGSAQDIDFIWIGYTNMTTSATMRIDAADTEGELSTTPDFSMSSATFLDPFPTYSGAREEWDRVHGFYDLGSTQSWRYWRLIFSDSSNPDGFVEVGRVLMGLKYQPGINIAFGGTLPFPHSQSDKIELEDGTIYPVPRGIRRNIDVNFQFAGSNVELHRNLYRYAMSRGATRPILYIHDPTDTYAQWGTVYGIPTTPWVSADTEHEWRNVRFSLEEMP